MGDNPKTAQERMAEAWANKDKPLADMTVEEAQAFFESLATISDDITIEAARNGDTAAGYLLELEKLGSLMTQTHNVLSSRGIDNAMDEYRKELYGDAKAAELQQAEAERKKAEKAANEQVQAVHDAHGTVQAAATLCATACRYAMHDLKRSLLSAGLSGTDLYSQVTTILTQLEQDIATRDKNKAIIDAVNNGTYTPDDGKTDGKTDDGAGTTTETVDATLLNRLKTAYGQGMMSTADYYNNAFAVYDFCNICIYSRLAFVVRLQGAGANIRVLSCFFVHKRLRNRCTIHL